jgi:acid phosphatase
VLVVVLENHGLDQAWNRMPYLRSLGQRYGYASDYRGVAHPSLPNYLALAGGSTFGVHDDAGPAEHPLAGATVFGQALAAGKSAKTYAEGLPRPCGRSSTSRYAVKHDPWPYFPAEHASCVRFSVPAGTAAGGPFASDARADALPTVGLLVPDLCHDGHDCGLSVADVWLRQWLAPVLAGADFTTGKLAVVVTFDEDDRFSGNRVLTVVAADQLHGVVVGQRLSHLSLSRWLSQLSGSPGLRDAATATSLGTAFGLA